MYVLPPGLPDLPEVPRALLGGFWMDPINKADAAVYLGTSIDELRDETEREGGLPHHTSESGVTYTRASLWRHLQEHDTP